MQRTTRNMFALMALLGAAALVSPDASAQMRGGMGGSTSAATAGGGHAAGASVGGSAAPTRSGIGGARGPGVTSGAVHPQSNTAFRGRNDRFSRDRFGFRDRDDFAFRQRFSRHRFAFRDRDDFAFRHRFFRRRFAFAAIGDNGCFRARHVWTPSGWRWRRTWVCG